jgi:Double zinc ribbon
MYAESHVRYAATIALPESQIQVYTLAERRGLVMLCPNCACELPAVARFCVRCGSQLALAAKPQVAEQFASPLLPQQTLDASAMEKRARFPDAEAPPPYAYATGKTFIVPQDAVLPSRCVKCGNSPTEPWLKKTYSWHHPALYFLMISPIIYVIVALIVRKRIELAVPLCSAHKSIRKKRLWAGAILLLTCIPLPVAFATYIGNDPAAAVAVWAGLAMFVVGLVFLTYASPVKPVLIRGQQATFKGACPEFLARLRPAPN